MVKHILTGLTKDTSLVTLDMSSPKLSGSCAMSLLQQMTTNYPTLSLTVSEVNVVGVGRVKIDRGTITWCVISDLIPENCVEFFRALNSSGLKVTKLNLQDLTDQTAEHLAVGLAESQLVQALTLKHCSVSSAGAVSIFRSLEHNTSLEELDLSENSQLAKGDSEALGCAIERMLNVNTTLKVLNLSRLTNEVVSNFANGLTQNHSLRKVTLNWNNYGNTSAVSIFRSLEHNTSLEELNLSWNSQLAEGDSEAVGCAIERMLKVNRTLKVLNVSGCNVTDPIVKHILTALMKNTSLVTLDMGSPKLSGSCAVSLFQQMATHPILHISVGEVNVLGVGRVRMDRGTMWCVISDLIPKTCVEFFRALNSSGLKVSKLNVQDLTDRTADHFAVGLAESESVQTLKLKHCSVSSTGAVSIFRSLEHNTSLEELDLSNKSKLAEGDSEAVGCAIERMLKVNRTLKMLNLSECGFTSELASYFAKGLAQNHSVRKVILHSNNIGSTGTVSIFKSLEHNTSLEELDLSENWPLAEGDSDAVGCTIERILNVNRTLKVLNLPECGFISELASYFAKGLAQNHSVRKVILHSNNIGSTGAVSIFKSLEHNTSLEELDLSENWPLAEGDSEAVGCAIERILKVNRTLKVLNLSGCNVTDSIVKHILTALMKNTSLVTFNLGSPTLSGSCAVFLFQQMTTHPTLSITVSEVNVVGVGRVKMDRGTMWCVISDLIPENCVEFFRALNSSGLKVSKLNVEDLTDQTADCFAVGLAESQCVSALKLSYNLWERKSITSAGAVSIFRSLEHNTNLKELDLSENSQLAEGDSETVGCAIEKMLNVNKTLKVLNLYGCRLTNEVVSYFANGIAQNHSVRKVILCSNNISSTGAERVFRSLEYNTSLEELDLSENSQLADGDSEAVGCATERMLKVNRTLKALNLSGCNVTDSIVKHILTALMKNTSLVTLDMSSPKLSGSCAVSLFQQMTTHPTLSITVGEVNVMGVGRVKMDRGTITWCVISDLIPENCVEFFRALNSNALKVSKLNVQDLTDRIAKHFAVGLAESQLVQALKLQHCNISCNGAVSIFRSLEHNTSLEELDLSENSQLAEGDSEAVGCAIERILNVNRTLKV